MKFFAIPPRRHTQAVLFSDGAFCLAHLYLQDSEYRKDFLSIRQNYKFFPMILDNGAAEKSLVTDKRLIECVVDLQPNEVVAPDVLYDAQQTWDNFQKFVDMLNQVNMTGRIQVMGVPQGKNKADWFWCFEKMILHPHCHVIGLSKIAIPYCWKQAQNDQEIANTRIQCVQELITRYPTNLLKKKQFHCLGMGDPEEFAAYRQVSCSLPLRSSDSCYSFLAAMHGFSFEELLNFAPERRRIPTPHSYFESQLDQATLKLAYKNIKFLQTQYKDV